MNRDPTVHSSAVQQGAGSLETPEPAEAVQQRTKMTLFQKVIRISGSIALVAGALVLSGCYTSEEPLISVKDADFPFERITYLQDGSTSETTVVRHDDGYRSDPDDNSEPVLLKEMAENTYLAQAVTDKGALLYAVITVAPDRTMFFMSATEATEADFAAVQRGVPGLAVCDDPPDAICIRKADGFVAYARNSEKRSAFRILSIR